VLPTFKVCLSRQSSRFAPPPFGTARFVHVLAASSAVVALVEVMEAL
jgi:hypothetical protein